jgi:signal transduction histidine kinase
VTAATGGGRRQEAAKGRGALDFVSMRRYWPPPLDAGTREAAMATPMTEPRSRWYRSFYWRIGISFLLLVVAVIVAQNVMFGVLMRRTATMGPPHLRASAVAADVAPLLSHGSDPDLTTFLMARFADPRQRIYVVTPDGAVAGNTSQPIESEVRRAALTMLGVEPVQPGSQTGPAMPIVTAPVQVDGALRALVVMPPPPMSGLSREVGRLLSLPGTLVLFLATLVATLLIFGPARRRLTALEDAAARLGGGDLSARAPAAGGDEIARVAQAFNRMADDLATRDEALRTADALRRQMLADVSHELRTPLTTMRGYLETLRMPELQADATTRERYLETVARETRRLERIVDELLDLARLEGGGGEISPRLFDVERLFAAVVQRHEPELAARHVTARVAVGRGADQVFGDPHRLEQAIENLFANALRHTPEGRAIELAARSVAGAVEIVVSDTGIGIPSEHLPHLFDRFYKVDAGRAAGTGGSGLGLSIVKAIVERHGGAIAVESEPGRTTFTVRLPLDG